MRLLHNPIRPYAWGSRTAIPALLGAEPTGQPQAELWMGAHPGDPSYVEDRAGELWSLRDLIAADPERELGAGCLGAFGPRLPYLFKLLAADEPLSLQAHPNPEQAREGYAREDAAGLAPDAPTRNYRDADAKPELVCALEPFEALSGFRLPEETLRIADRLDVAELAPYLLPLRSEPGEAGLRETFTGLMTVPEDRRRAVVDAVLGACARHADDLAEADLLLRLGVAYPGDIGVVAALLLNHVVLAPGEALYLPAGNLHAYVRGLAVELMGNSDNVLRGGLTSKHIDVPELLHVLEFVPRPVDRLVPVPDPGGGPDRYPAPAREFQLASLAVDGEAVLDPAGPQILLCVEGSVTAYSGGSDTGVGLAPGRSAFGGADEGPVRLRGSGRVYRATRRIEGPG